MPGLPPVATSNTAHSRSRTSLNILVIVAALVAVAGSFALYWGTSPCGRAKFFAYELTRLTRNHAAPSEQRIVLLGVDARRTATGYDVLAASNPGLLVGVYGDGAVSIARLTNEAVAFESGIEARPSLWWLLTNASYCRVT